MYWKMKSQDFVGSTQPRDGVNGLAGRKSLTSCREREYTLRNITEWPDVHNTANTSLCSDGANSVLQGEGRNAE
ncbi:UNVERIFIED_CONTAM: hypothetical protein NY603_26340, partial [Bacteroidetes bacterium 56_B9]